MVDLAEAESLEMIAERLEREILIERTGRLDELPRLTDEVKQAYRRCAFGPLRR